MGFTLERGLLSKSHGVYFLRVNLMAWGLHFEEAEEAEGAEGVTSSMCVTSIAVSVSRNEYTLCVIIPEKFIIL